MTFLAHIADKAFNRPLLLTPDKTRVLIDVLAGRIGLSSAELNQFTGSPVVVGEDGMRKMVPLRVTSDGVGIMTLSGSLVNRGAWIGSSSGLISYEGLQFQISAAKNTKEVKSVILDLDCPGGEAVGCFKTAAAIRDLAAVKPVIAVVNSLAASGGYALASGATEIVVEPDGYVGSIGVVMVHTDYSKSLENEGITPTIMFAGAHKVDGNPFEPLGDEVKAEWHAEMMQIYDEFLVTVAAGRGGRTSKEQARATEARIYRGADAVAAGLADRVGSFELVLSDLSRGAGRTTSQVKGKRMSEISGAPVAEQNAGITQTQLNDAVVKGSEAAVKADRERMAGLDVLAGKVGGNAAALQIIATAKQDGSSVEATGLKLINADAFTKAAVLTAIAADDKTAVAAAPAAADATTQVAAVPQTEAGWTAEYEANKAIRGEFLTVGSYIAFKKRDAAQKEAQE